MSIPRACGAAGVRALVVLSAGFSELGREGAARQAELLAICRASGMRLVGPNCLGVLNTDVGLNASFAPVAPPAGHVAFGSQSGAFGIAAIAEAVRRGLGLSSFVSTGNKADLSGNDLLQHWESDDSTDVIGWNVGGTGFEIVLTAGVADVIAQHFPAETAAFLADHSLAVGDVAAWVAHPGGPRILEAFEHALDVPRDALARSWETLDRVGNLSSAAVLHVLADTLDSGATGPALLFALGPGVSAEFVLLELP